jgi:hypothetical protein
VVSAIFIKVVMQPPALGSADYARFLEAHASSFAPEAPGQDVKTTGTRARKQQGQLSGEVA